MVKTLSEIYRRDPVQRTHTQRLALTLVMHASDATIAATRYWLDSVDAIAFGRGARSGVRDEHNGLRRLLINVPDPFMSSDHGRMLRVQGKWIIESPRSKNGVVVAGRATRCGPVEIDDVIEVGHTLFLLESVSGPGVAEAEDQVLSSQGHALPLLASLHPELVVAEVALARIAPSTVPVLLHGETGTGKEVYANAVHHGSSREGPFVAINCGALLPSLLEAELFGHKRGTFTGATADRAGYVRSADRGTLFLDEINELSPAGQVALLRVLEEGEVVAVGDSRPAQVDIRVCAASQRPLLGEVEAGRFRSDLYARLLGFELRLPPLCERRGDLGYIIAGLARRLSASPIVITPAAIRALVTFEWPRNVRELERCLAAAIVLSGDGVIDLPHLPAAIADRVVAPAPAPAMEEPDGSELPARLAAKLVEHRGNVSAVARDLGTHREQIHRWIRRFGLDIDRFRR